MLHFVFILQCIKHFMLSTELLLGSRLQECAMEVFVRRWKLVRAAGGKIAHRSAVGHSQMCM